MKKTQTLEAETTQSGRSVDNQIGNDLINHSRELADRINALIMENIGLRAQLAETTQKGMTALDKFEVEYPDVEVNSAEEAMDFLLYNENARDGDKELCDALEKEMVAEDRRMAKILLSEEVKE